MTTIVDVAKLAGVSKSTVSQYLNNRYHYMSADTKKRVEHAIAELNYRPNIVARSLKQKKTSMIGIIVANILHSFSTNFTRAVEDICHEHDIHVIICNADDDPEKERRYIETLRDKQVDGLIVFPTGGNIELYESMVKENFPIVFVDRYIKNIKIDTILLDNDNAAALAVQLFKENGYKRMGILTNTLVHHVTPRIERVEGFKKALQENQLPIKEEWIQGIEISGMQDYLENMFSKNEKPQALLAGNDLTLMEILKFVNRKRLRVPQDLALIVIDHVSFASFFEPGITTIIQPTVEMAQEAAKLLLKKINQNDESETQNLIRFKPELIKRQSC
jgi:LacI family kdg operon repressor